METTTSPSTASGSGSRASGERRVVRFFEWFLPAAVAEGRPGLYRIGRLVVLLSLVGVPFWLGFAAWYWFVRGSMAATITLLVGGVVHGLVPLVLRRSGSLFVSANLLGANMVGTLAVVGYIKGGFPTTVLMWHVVVPMAAALLGRIQMLVVWATVVLLEFTTFYVLTVTGVTAVPGVSEHGEVHLEFAALVGLVVLMSATTGFYERGRARAFRRWKQVQSELDQAARFEAIGEMAGGLAHEFNNLLSVIMNFSQLLRDDLAPDDPRREDVEHIRTAARRGAALTRQLLMLSRRDAGESEVLDVNELFRGLRMTLRRALPENIEVRLQSPPDIPCIEVDRSQIEQVFLNLAFNARDAMPEGGVLSWEASEVTVAEGPARDLGVRPGRHVRLRVSDTGHGMAAEVASRVFEPFFTTKGRHKGTGLGLAAAYRTVDRAGGRLALHSELGVGTTFTIHLPATEKQPTDTPSASDSGGALRGAETILLVEDEAAVRAGIARMLSRKGYVVLEAEDGREALAVVEQHDGHIDVLLSDVLMPNMSGSELAERLLATHRDLDVVFMSGYADEQLERHRVADLGTAFLSKPFSERELLGCLRAVSERRASPPRTPGATGPAAR
jgi:signal transduction histidine kinase/CheY-like chemotaxis protein